jgi:hypothetical protein
MSELTLTLLRLGFLALLWLLVLSVVGVLRRDLFGTQVRRKETPAGSTRSRLGRARTPAAVGADAGAGPVPAPPRTPPRGVPVGGLRHVVVTGGSLKGTSIALTQAPILIGRGPECTLVLDDDYASNRHAQLSLRDGVWMLEDLGSTNGTFVGRSRLSAPVAVQAGTSFRIGRTTLELRR